MEPVIADSELPMTGLEQPASADAELATDGTTIDAAPANGSEDASLANHEVVASTGVKRAVDAAGSNVVVDAEQPLEPVAKKPRADEHATEASNAEQPFDEAPAAAERLEHPAASSQDAAAVAQSPSKARPSPAPSTARSPAARRVGDVVLRVLVLDRSVATIIGKGGATVKAIQNSSGARVQAMPPVPGVEERVVVLSNPEDQQQIVSGAEKALLAIQRKLILELEPSAAAVLDKVQQELAPQPAAESAAAQSIDEPHTATTAQSEAVACEAEPMAAGVGGSEAAEDTSAAAPQSAEAGEGSSVPAANDVTFAEAAADSTVTVNPTTLVDTAQPAALPTAAAAAAAHAEEQPTVDDAKQPATADAQQLASAEAELPAIQGPVQAAAAADAGQPANAAAAANTAAASSEHATSAAEGTAADNLSVVVPAVAAEEPAAAGTDQPAAAEPQLNTPAAQTPPISPAPKSTTAIIPALGGGSPPPPRPLRSVQHVARMLVSHSQANSLLTAGASGLRAIKDQSGAFVKVLQADESPFCALEGDRVAQVVGTAEQVFRAVMLLGAHLRKHPAIERPGGLHPGLAARVGGGRMYSGRGHRSPPPPPPPRAAYGAAYGPPGYGAHAPGYGEPGTAEHVLRLSHILGACWCTCVDSKHVKQSSAHGPPCLVHAVQTQGRYIVGAENAL